MLVSSDSIPNAYRLSMGKGLPMSLSPDELTSAVECLRSALARKKERLRRRPDQSDKRDVTLSVKDRYPDISDDQIYEVMRGADK